MNTVATSRSKIAHAPSITESLASRDRWSPERLLSYQRDRVCDVLAHAVARSPYYREVLGEQALAPEVRLDELPTLPKATLMDEFDRVVTDPRLRLAAIDEHIRSGDPGALSAASAPVALASA
jgi:phenylacetate-CoA ligase